MAARWVVVLMLQAPLRQIVLTVQTELLIQIVTAAHAVAVMPVMAATWPWNARMKEYVPGAILILKGPLAITVAATLIHIRRNIVAPAMLATITPQDVIHHVIALTPTLTPTIIPIIPMAKINVWVIVGPAMGRRVVMGLVLVLLLLVRRWSLERLFLPGGQVIISQ